jgi:hypothetical protein
MLSRLTQISPLGYGLSSLVYFVGVKDNEERGRERERVKMEERESENGGEREEQKWRGERGAKMEERERMYVKYGADPNTTDNDGSGGE